MYKERGGYTNVTLGDLGVLCVEGGSGTPQLSAGLLKRPPIIFQVMQK